MMRKIRTISTVALLFAALFGVSVVQGAARPPGGGKMPGRVGVGRVPGPNFRVSRDRIRRRRCKRKGEVTFRQMGDDPPLDDGTTYTLSYNSSGGSGKKASGGFTLYGTDGSFLGGKTIDLCQYPDGTTRIINSVNPPKKSGVQEAAYLIITIDKDGNETVDAVQARIPAPTC
jgi:hypothetical protein